MNRLPNFVWNSWILTLTILANVSCGHMNSEISDVKISFPGENLANAVVEYNTSSSSNSLIKFWKPGEELQVFTSEISNGKKNHSVLLSNLLPGQQYIFNIITSNGSRENSSGKYSFKTIDYSNGIKDSFRITRKDTALIPGSFNDGYILMHRREFPGIAYLLDSRGNVIWYYQLKKGGIKVLRFTKNQTFLALVGTKEFDKGYGNIILELSIAGDTLLCLKKGQNDFRQTIHHEILLNPKNEIVTLYNEERIVDLQSKGGSSRDTVHGDGILVLDRQGHQTWKWSVFDAMDPLHDENIMKNKKDWMHANSIAFDLDGNYLVSFYNNGQIWKIDAVTGRVIWKFGQNGDFDIPGYAEFDQAHAVYVNEHGWLMFFDNGTNRRLSRAMGFKLDESSRKAQLLFNATLPPNLFSERMGSSYLVDESYLLSCASAQKAVVLTNLRGQIVWQLNASRLHSYRAQFIPKQNVAGHISNLYAKN